MGPFAAALAGGLASGIGGGLIGGLFGGGKKNAASAAMPYLERVPEYGYNAYNPFINKGKQAEEQLYPMYSQFASNPTDYLNQVMSQYEPSKGYQYREGRNLRAAHNTAAAGGYAGTPNDEENRTQMVNALMNEDMQQFLQNVLGIQGAGLSGLENRVEHGYGASGSLADYLGGAQGQMGSAAFGGAASRNANKSAMINSLIGAGAQGAGNYYGAKNGGQQNGFNPLSGINNQSYQNPNYGLPNYGGKATAGLFPGGLG